MDKSSGVTSLALAVLSGHLYLELREVSRRDISFLLSLVLRFDGTYCNWNGLYRAVYVRKVVSFLLKLQHIFYQKKNVARDTTNASFLREYIGGENKF